MNIIWILKRKYWNFRNHIFILFLKFIITIFIYICLLYTCWEHNKQKWNKTKNLYCYYRILGSVCLNKKKKMSEQTIKKKEKRKKADAKISYSTKIMMRMMMTMIMMLINHIIIHNDLEKNQKWQGLFHIYHFY